MLRIPSTLNNEVYVQIDESAFDMLKKASAQKNPDVTYRHYIQVRPYLRNDSKVIRYATDRWIQGCYLLVKNFARDEDLSLMNNVHAFKYIEIMNGVTNTYGEDTTDCFITGIDNGARFYIDSNTFTDKYALWALLSLNVIPESTVRTLQDRDEWTLNIPTTIGHINIFRKRTTNDVIINKDVVDLNKEKVVDEKIDVDVDTNKNVSVDDRSDDLRKVTVEEPVTSDDNNLMPEFKIVEDNDNTGYRRYEKENLLKFSIQILSLPNDPEFINENVAVRRRMYQLYWELNE